VCARTKLLADAEITLEANPGTFEIEKFTEYCAAGINRLSIGIQSFNDAHLSALGRVHNAGEAERAVDIGLKTFPRVNLDLMYALPNQTEAAAKADIARAIASGVTHISAYQLTLEPNTLFHAQPPPLPDDEACGAIEEVVHGELANAGFARYEISAFARKGETCAHNLNYWRFGDYVGIGAGAHGKLSFPNRVERTVKAKQPEQYMNAMEAGDAVIERRELARSEFGFEFMLNALRLTSGVTISLFAERTGFPVSLIASQLDVAEKKGLLTRDHLRFAPTELGLRYLNDLQELFLV
jgi:putative oxygen-independent coproporphyrinogen III oxidase